MLKKKKATLLLPAKLKARLVARGFTQRYRINYEETHALVARIASIRALFAICVATLFSIIPKCILIILKTTYHLAKNTCILIGNPWIIEL